MDLSSIQINSDHPCFQLPYNAISNHRTAVYQITIKKYLYIRHSQTTLHYDFYDMKPLAIRPRCSLSTTLMPDEIMQAIVGKLRENKEKVAGNTLLNHAYLKIPENEQNYWSPELHITVEAVDGGSIINGVVGPKPKIWTMFMFFYTGIIVLFLFGSVMGVSQWMLGMSAPWLWSIPASAILWLGVFMAAKFGQRKGNKQMARLRNFIDTVLEEAENK